jgi:glyoxylase-like metal-dependent hydrolase (beta-lactamase superfamily II)
MTDIPASLSRRNFVSQIASLGALWAFAATIPFPAFAESLADDPRISQTPLVEAGFASVRKIGEGAYATISDPSKGFATICNGGFLVGKDFALLIEGFGSPAGAAFQVETLRKISQVPVMAALDTHYHYDHTFGNTFYGANGISLWGHAAASKRMFDSYVAMQGADRSTVLAPFERRVRESKSDIEKQHAQTDLAAFGNIYDMANKGSIAGPNHPLDPGKLPMAVDLGNLKLSIETYPGHSGTDLVVRVPDQKVVYSGDLIFNGAYPACFDDQATISGWRSTLKTFASWDKDTFSCPGTARFVGKRASRSCARCSTISPNRPKRCTRPGYPCPKLRTAMWFPKTLKLSPFGRGGSQWAMRSPSCTGNTFP